MLNKIKEEIAFMVQLYNKPKAKVETRELKHQHEKHGHSIEQPPHSLLTILFQ